MSPVPRHTLVAHAALRHVNLLASAPALANAAGISESADTSAPMQMRASPLARSALHRYADGVAGQGKAKQMTKVVIGSDTVETPADVAENWGESAMLEDAVRHDEGRLAKETGK